MSYTNQGSTQPFRSSDLQCREDQANANRKTESTQAFTDPEAVRGNGQRLNAGLATESVPTVSPGGPASIKQSALSKNLPIDPTKATEALSEACSISLPDARLVVAYPSWSGQTNPAIVPLPQNTYSCGMFGVLQRTQDVSFRIQIPFYNHSSVPPSTRSIPFRLECNIFYSPASDACLLENRSLMDIILMNENSDQKVRRLSWGQTQLVVPGFWRISIGGDGLHEQHLIDVLILQRRHEVSLHRSAEKSTLGKRILCQDASLTVKRQRREDDMTEILFTAASTSYDTGNPEQSLTSISKSPLVALRDGDIAIVEKRQSPSNAPSDAEFSNPMTSYKLKRLDVITNTPSASLFVTHHSSWPKRIVAKVIKYEGNPESSLRRCALSWEREKRFLERVNHVSRQCYREKDLALKYFSQTLSTYMALMAASLRYMWSSCLAP